MKKQEVRNKAILVTFCTLLVLIAAFSVINLFTAKTAYGNIEQAWDGVEVATSFSAGNGTEENPYQITKGSELAYLRQVVNDNLLPDLENKYFVLSSDIDLGGNTWIGIGTIGEEGHTFTGHFDGAGYTIKNFKIDTPVETDKTDYYGFFTSINNAEIKNLNISQGTLITQVTEKETIAGLVAAKVSGESNLKNIAIIDSKLDLTNTLATSTSTIGGFAATIAKDSNIKNIYNQLEITDSNANNFGNTIGILEGTAKNIITEVTYTNLISTYSKEIKEIREESEVEGIYNLEKRNNKLQVLNPKDTKIDQIIRILNQDIEEDYTWILDSMTLKIIRKDTLISSQNEIQVPIYFNFGKSASITLHDTGIEGETAYINDLESDYNYYLGLNYTQSNDRSLPSGENQNIYNDSNLVKVYVKYSGASLSNAEEKGYISLKEQQSEMVYYKYYPVVDGKVTFDLIDNPFADRPTDKAFNGWITDYNGAVLGFDKSTYTRTVTVPVTYTNGIPDMINITFHASWIKATKTEITVNNSDSWANAMEELKSPQMQPITDTKDIYEGLEDLYIYVTGEVGFYGQFPSGAYDSNHKNIGGNLCTSFSGCSYYIHSDGKYDSSATYYEYKNGRFSVTRPSPTGQEIVNMMDIGTSASALYKQVTLSRGQSLSGYYNASGELQTSGSCNTYSGCTYYQLVQFYDENNNPNVVTEDDNYYYLATRDTNIIVLKSYFAQKLSSSDKPYTLTGLDNHQNYNPSFNISYIPLNVQADARIEYITLQTESKNSTNDAGGSSNTSTTIYGNFHNLKIGRGIKRNSNNVSATNIMGGSNSGIGSKNSVKKYKLIIESGYYNTAEVVNGGTRNGNAYIAAQGVFGNDYDRITNNNDNLEVYYSAVGSWGSNIYSNNNNQDLAIDSTIKSGKFGTGKGDVSFGFYVGGRGYGNHYAPKRTVVEGGWIYNLNGGPLTVSNSQNLNETYTYVKGGQVDFVFGGAGTSTTYGNRIIGVTGGTINYAVFGGSNGFEGYGNDGKLTGVGFVYIGGNAVIGNDDYELNESRNENWGVEKGSVFGIGNGKSSSDSIGSAKSSVIIIDRDATINKNVYGGGNYGSVGISSSTSSDIKILGGTVKGSVYGGGNNNGAGTNRIPAEINIEMTGGTVEGSIYGGSRTKGSIYGSSSVNIVNGTIGTDVYGGGEGGYDNRNNPGTYVEEDVNVTVGNENEGPNINGSVYGGSAYGTVNGLDENERSSDYSTTVTVNNGTIKQSVFGGGKGNNSLTPKVYGNVTVTVNNGNIGSVFGGNDAKGNPDGEDYVYLNGGIIGDAFGGGNQTGQPETNIYLQGATVNSLYGGSNQSGDVTTTNVHVSSGTSGNVFGGNNLGGSTETDNVEITGGTITGDVYGGGNLAPVETVNLYIGQATINNAYGGGKSADADTTDSKISGATIENFYGGSNITGKVLSATIHMTDGDIGTLYGGNNAGGKTVDSSITVQNGIITSIYGGGNKAPNTTSKITVNNGQISYIYGGGNEAGLDDTSIRIYEGDIGTVYGGSNKSGDIDNTEINVGGEKTTKTLNVTTKTDMSNLGIFEQWTSGHVSEGTIDVILENESEEDISNWEVKVEIPNSTYRRTSSNANISADNGIYTITSKEPIKAGKKETISFTIYSDDYADDVKATATLISPQPSTFATNPSVNSIFGGNNMGGVTDNSKINVESGNIGNIYGGGNEAPVNTPNVKVTNATVNNVFGGGNMASISNDTSVTITNSTVQTNIYGGGNYGQVNGSTDVKISSCNIAGSAYGGGNGASAIVNENTTITVDGTTTIGTETSVAPQQGCLFGGGNAAATGTQSKNKSLATVNLVGGKIYGNVYGGANTSVVYGKTDTNIGTEAVSEKNLQEETIDIGGTVFGGGEANAEGSENYDFSFISVTGAIDIEINGTNYLNNSHDFLISGSIFGSGNASSSSGTSEIYIKNLGTRENPSQNISIQRANEVVLDNVTMELAGTTDRTNEYSDMKYSLNRIDELNIKNNTMLLLQQNANLLKHFKSTVDKDGKEEKAAVIIDEDTKKVEKNVDNRLYMIANKNLNITTNEAATEYGEVDGMTFFGMYQKYGNGTFSYGLYDDSVNYGDAGDAGDIIIGGSYVLGLHKSNHDITVDGFYSNYINDDYTEITTKYIEPTPPDSNYYMWTIGISAINYSFTMTASKYSSLGTYELSMIEFSKGDTTFEVIGFNSEGLTPGVGLIDSNNVPKLADTEEDANSILGLSMKTETSEWTSYGTTKFLSDNGGSYTGDKSYKTDSQQLAPSLMFYLYHAKNISLNQDLGTVVITMQALTPKNEIEYDVQLITITIDLTAKEYDDGNAYDASITYDKKYEMPAATNVNITNQSQFTAYFDLYAQDSFENLYGRNNDNYHALVTDYVLPVGTQITMLDYSSQEGIPKYYYYNIDEEEYNRATQQLENENEVTYRIDKFIKMGSTDEDNTYDEKAANESYYDEKYNRTIEEFLFIFDFKETTTTGTHLNQYMRFELRNNEDRTVVTVLGIRQNYMYFNLYDTSNIVLQQEVNFDNNYIYPNTNRHIDYQTAVTYDQTANRESIINTNYESTNMGLNIKIYDSSGNQVSSSQLTGTSIRMDGVEYFADSEGVYRIKLAGKVSNLKKDLYLLTDTSLPAGDYTMQFSLFASSDGLHNTGGMQETSQEVAITVVPGGNAIEVSSQDEYKVVDGNTRLNKFGTSEEKLNAKIAENLESSNLRVSVYKRNIDNKETTAYTEIDFNELFSTELSQPSMNGLINGSTYERFIATNITSQSDLTWSYAENMISGTYRIVLKLYDDNQLIDEDIEYIIVKK